MPDVGGTTKPGTAKKSTTSATQTPGDNDSSSTAPTRQTLALKGSSKMVSEFFEYSINTILYQRGVYAAEDFKVVKKYGLNMLVTIDDDVRRYVRRIMQQLHRWMGAGKVNKLVVCIVAKETAEVVERWQFDVDVLPPSSHQPGASADPVGEAADKSSGSGGSGQQLRDEAEVQKEIQSLIRQITASVTFLPELRGRVTFNVLVYTDLSGSDPAPENWIDSDARDVKGDAERVQLRTFSTGAHRVGVQVAYSMDDTLLE